MGWNRNTLKGVTSRRAQAENGQSAADEHSPVTTAVTFAPLDDATIEWYSLRHAQQLLGQVRFVVGQIPHHRDLDGAIVLFAFLIHTNNLRGKRTQLQRQV